MKASPRDRYQYSTRKINEAKIASINIGTDFDTSKKAIELALKHDNLFASVGYHPGDIKIGENIDLDILSNLALKEKVVAIGECGLDYYRIDENNFAIKKSQKEIFEFQ